MQAQGIARARRNAGVVTSTSSLREDACKGLPRACSSGLHSGTEGLAHGSPEVMRALWTSGVRSAPTLPRTLVASATRTRK